MWTVADHNRLTMRELAVSITETVMSGASEVPSLATYWSAPLGVVKS
jgi:hypothetical protein